MAPAGTSLWLPAIPALLVMLSVSVPVGSEWWEEVDGQGGSGTLQTAVNYSKMFCIKEEHSKEKEGKNTTHSINQKDALLGYSLLGKALIYQRQEKNPTNRLVNPGMTVKLRDDAKPLQLVVCRPYRRTP